MMIMRLIMSVSVRAASLRRRLRDIGAMPPAAAERLEQGRGIRIAIGLGLYQADARLLPRALRVQQREVIDRAELILPPREIEAGGRGALRGGLRDHRIGIGLQRPQRISDVLARLDHRAAILRRGLLERRDGGALLVQQRAGVEQRLRDTAGDAPHAGARREHIGEAAGGGAKRRADGELRQLVCGRHADLGGCCMKLRLGGADIRTLFDKLRWQADRQIVRQMHAVEVEGFARLRGLATGRRAR